MYYGINVIISQGCRYMIPAVEYQVSFAMPVHQVRPVRLKVFKSLSIEVVRSHFFSERSAKVNLKLSKHHGCRWSRCILITSDLDKTVLAVMKGEWVVLDYGVKEGGHVIMSRIDTRLEKLLRAV